MPDSDESNLEPQSLTALLVGYEKYEIQIEKCDFEYPRYDLRRRRYWKLSDAPPEHPKDDETVWRREWRALIIVEVPQSGQNTYRRVGLVTGYDTNGVRWFDDAVRKDVILL